MVLLIANDAPLGPEWLDHLEITEGAPIWHARHFTNGTLLVGG